MRPWTLGALFLAGLMMIVPVQTALLPNGPPNAPGPTVHLDEDDSAPAAAQPASVAVRELLSDAESSGRIHLPLADGDYEIELLAHPISEPGTKAFRVDGETGAAIEEASSPVHTYLARRAGRPTWDSTVTLSENFVDVVLWLDDCERLGLSTPGDTLAPDGQLPVVTYRRSCAASSEDASNEGDNGGTIGSLSDYTTVPYEDLNVEPANGWSRPSSSRTVRIALDSDASFYNLGPSNWAARQLAVFNSMKLPFVNHLNINFNVVVQYTWTSGGPTLTAICNSGYTPTTDLLDWVGNSWRTLTDGRQSYTRDSVLFLYERDLDGSTVGCGYTPGVQDPLWWGYAVVQTRNRDSTQEYRTAAHEVGHNYNGEHAVARVWRAWQCAWLCKKGTLMATGIPTENKIDEFTAGNSASYNAWRIRWCAENQSRCNQLYDY